MKNTLAGLFALASCAVLAASAGAADDNDVFQPACFFRSQTSQSSPVTAYSAPVVTSAPCNSCAQPAPACNACQQPACNTCQQCSTNYVQKYYYQAVTSYQSQSYYEPVTTYQSSYYYDPVTTYRTSYYYCPETCSYKQTCTPEVSYQLKTKSCPVQGYVQKCAQVPVTTYQKSFYLEPQTTCCQTSVGPPVAGVMAPPSGPPQATVTPQPQPGAPLLPPIVDEKRSPNSTPPGGNSYYPPQPQSLKQTAPPPGNASWQPVLPAPGQPASPTAPPPSPTVKLDRIVFGADAVVEGEVVKGDKSPRASAKVLFVNANQPTSKEIVTANDAGRFMVTLAPGGWMAYVYDSDNNPVFINRIEVNDETPTAKITLVNR